MVHARSEEGPFGPPSENSTGRRGHRTRNVAFAFIAAMTVVAGCVQPVQPVAAANFQIKSVFRGLNLPTAVRFASDGRVFVAERTGRILAYDSVSDGSATTVVDLSPIVTTMWDRGLSGIELDPGFATGRPYLYALYSLDAPLGGTPPAYPDDCLFSGVGNNGVCGITSGQLRRIEVGPDNKAVSQTVLINDWCQQYGGHSVGDLEFAPDGSLLVSSGEGASFETIDRGQLHGNPCGDPVNEGGMLRSQDARTTGDPTGLSGSVIRINPDTGAAWPTNPWASDPDTNRAKIIAYGFREPFRLSVDSVTNKLYVGDVGWSLWEELNEVDLNAPEPANFGWPCYEGNDIQPGVAAENIPLCQSLTPAEVKAPAFTYSHTDRLDTQCGSGGTSITGIATVRNNSYPAPYRNGLYIADYSRQCVFFMPRTSTGAYNYAGRKTLVTLARAVDLQVGPGGDLYFADIVNGSIQRIVTTGTNHPPEARLTANPGYGPVPLTVTLDGSTSTDIDVGEGSTLSYAWDLDSDGEFDDGTGAVITPTFTTAGNVRVALEVTDLRGASTVAESTIFVGNEPPVPVIDLPVAATVPHGTQVNFAGHATDPQDGAIPASGLSWKFIIQHCDTPTSCHEHEIASLNGTAGSHFEMPAHPAPSYLDVVLTATDSGGATASSTVRLTIG